MVKKRLKILQNFAPQFPNIKVKTRNGREQAQIGNNNKSVAAENREQSGTMRNFETCSFRRLLAVTRHQFAFCVADPVRSVQTEWQFDSSERPQKICVNLRNLWINSVPCHPCNPWLSVLSQFVFICVDFRHGTNPSERGRRYGGHRLKVIKKYC